LESDVLSLEIEYVFKEVSFAYIYFFLAFFNFICQCYVDGDLSSLNVVAQSLLKFQSMFGVIPNVKSKGVAARKVLQRMMHRRFEEEESAAELSSASSERAKNDVDTLVV
jgi:hypothetical protein